MTKIHHFSSYWKRQEKYDLLNNTEFANVPWQELELKEPYYFFVPKDFWVKEKYDEGFSVSEIFNKFSSWIHTWKDHLVIDIDKNVLYDRVTEVIEWDENQMRNKYDLIDTSWWILNRFKSTENNIENYVKLNFRPFDFRWIIYEGKALKRDRYNIMKHIFKKDNLWLVTIRRSRSNNEWNFITASKLMTTEPTTITSLDNNYFFPLYLYNEQNQKTLINLPEKTPNFNPEIIAKIEEKLGLHLSVGNEYFHSESTKNGNENIRSLQEENNKNSFSPENIFDYIYAVLHSKTYRETYKEFLKIDFPKIHFDVSKETFFSLAKLWEELRSYHLLENPNLIAKNFITKYEIDGDNKVEKVRYLDEKVYINDTQYFAWVPKNVWEFYIWWYQPAQKWLKDRKDRNLNYDDIINYSKIILSLKETIIIMKEIEKIYNK